MKDLKNLLAIITTISSFGNALDDGLHPTPPMGFSSWNAFSTNITEEKMIKTVDAIKRLGLDKYGYKFVIVDDLWNEAEREANGKLIVDGERFPQGMKYLSDYIHQKGLKFGIYANAGHKTCADKAGSLGYEETDLEEFLEWKIDYLKYDNCYPNDDKEMYKMDKWKSLLHLPSMYQTPDEYTRYSKMGEALLAVKNVRNISFELCLYGWGNVEKWGHKLGHLWRTSGDIKDRWPSLLANVDKNDEDRFVHNQGPKKGWNFPDALFVGKGGMKLVEYKTMFALWSIMKSPLMLGSDLEFLSDEDLKVRRNPLTFLRAQFIFTSGFGYR